MKKYERFEKNDLYGRKIKILISISIVASWYRLFEKVEIKLEIFSCGQRYFSRLFGFPSRF